MMTFRPGLPGVDDGVADAQGELHLGAGEALGGVLEAELRLGHLRGVVVEERRTGDGQIDDLVLAGAEDLLPLGEGGGVVQVDHHMLGAADGVEGLLDDVGAGLGQDLDPHVVGDHVLLDDGTQEVIFRLGGGGEAHLDLLEPEAQQETVEVQLLLQAHGGDQGLVAVAKVHAAPGGGLFDALALRPVQAFLGGHVIAGTVSLYVLHGGSSFPSYSVRGSKKPSSLPNKETKAVKLPRYHSYWRPSTPTQIAHAPG